MNCDENAIKTRPVYAKICEQKVRRNGEREKVREKVREKRCKQYCIFVCG
jgi:hypothetical protein